MPAPEQNQNALKDEVDVPTSFLHLRVYPHEKAAWVKEARRVNRKLAEWTRAVLNKAASHW
jgi:hypothetical protein